MSDFEDESIRTRILDAIKERFSSISVGAGPDDYRYAYSKVTRSGLQNAPKGFNTAMTIYGGAEQKEHRTDPKRWVNMQIILEIFYLREKGKDPIKALEKLAQEAERRIMEDETWGGLATYTHILNVLPEVQGRFDNHSEVALILNTKFAHHMNDPRRKVGRRHA